MPELGTKESPVYIRDGSEREATDGYLTVLEVVNKTVMAAYAVLTAWEVAKILCPPLKVHQDIAVAWLRHRWESRRKASTVHVPHAWVREVYDYAREGDTDAG